MNTEGALATGGVMQRIFGAAPEYTEPNRCIPFKKRDAEMRSPLLKLLAPQLSHAEVTAVTLLAENRFLVAGGSEVRDKVLEQVFE